MTSTIEPLPPELRDRLPPALGGQCLSASYPQGARLFTNGQRPAFMFFVSRGEVTLERLGIQGDPVILQRTRRGLVGEASLQSERYHCDGLAVLDSEVTKIPVRALRSAMEADTAFSMRWVNMLNREVRRLRQQCERLMLNTVEARVLHLLETEGDGDGYALGSGLKSVAREIGVTHEALYRCIASLEKRGVVERSAGRLRLLPEPLAEDPADTRR